MKTNLEKLEGFGILCKSVEHGKEIIEFFVENGSKYRFISLDGSEDGMYYVVSSGEVSYSIEPICFNILTLEEAKELVNGEFPHKNWYIEVKEEYKKELNDWKVRQLYSDDLFIHKNTYVRDDGRGFSSMSDEKLLTKITIEQFRKYI